MTVAIEAMTFRKPVFVGDVVSVYTDTERMGRTSVTVRVEAWVTRRNESRLILVTDGTFAYVAIDADGRPTPVKARGMIRKDYLSANKTHSAADVADRAIKSSGNCHSFVVRSTYPPRILLNYNNDSLKLFRCIAVGAAGWGGRWKRKCRIRTL